MFSHSMKYPQPSYINCVAIALFSLGSLGETRGIIRP